MDYDWDFADEPMGMTVFQEYSLLLYLTVACLIVLIVFSILCYLELRKIRRAVARPSVMEDVAKEEYAKAAAEREEWRRQQREWGEREKARLVRETEAENERKRQAQEEKERLAAEKKERADYLASIEKFPVYEIFTDVAKAARDYFGLDPSPILKAKDEIEILQAWPEFWKKMVAAGKKDPELAKEVGDELNRAHQLHKKLPTHPKFNPAREQK